MLPVAGAIIKSTAVNYINPIKSSAKKLLIEKGIKNRLLNALDLSVSVTAPYINTAGQLGKTKMQKALLITGATVIPLSPDLKEMYEKRKAKQALMESVNTNFSIINPGSIAGTIIGGAFGGIAGATVGGIAGEMLYNKLEKQKNIKADLMQTINNMNNTNIENNINIENNKENAYEQVL